MEGSGVMLTRIFIFAAQLGKKTHEDDLFALSNELAYKILLSFFPFLIFMVSLLGFLDLEDTPFAMQLLDALPQEAGRFVGNFVAELQARPPAGILSISLLISIYSASNGFRAVIRGVNKAHAYKDERNWIKKTALCVGLMAIFTFSIIIMLALWMFSDTLLSMAQPYIPFNAGLVLQVASALISMLVLIGATAWMYRLACSRREAGALILPGACVTVSLWVISSEIFGIFISRYSNISVLYGSIAGIFILIVWLNLISFFLLFGNTVNALLHTIST